MVCGVYETTGGSAAGEYSNSKTLNSTNEPDWNEAFSLAVPDPANSQLECSIWDESGAGDTKPEKFLGEVILNLAKLVPHNKKDIEQVFEIKQGKTYKATAEDKRATGKLKLGLQLIIPDETGSGQASATASNKAPPPKEQPSAPKVRFTDSSERYCIS